MAALSSPTQAHRSRPQLWASAAVRALRDYLAVHGLAEALPNHAFIYRHAPLRRNAQRDPGRDGADTAGRHFDPDVQRERERALTTMVNRQPDRQSALFDKDAAPFIYHIPYNGKFIVVSRDVHILGTVPVPL